MKDSRRVFETPWFSIDELLQSDGSQFYRVTKPDGVVILALTADDKVVMIRHYRLARGRVSIELPAGSIDVGESPLRAAQRELLEETGYGNGEWTFLGKGGLSLDRDTATMHLYLARGVECLGAPEAGIDVLVTPLAELRELIMSGKCEQLVALAILGLASWQGLGDFFAIERHE
jgi:8-oxo-dGTP pyrophosphatase MutT (NUDIX family)